MSILDRIVSIYAPFRCLGCGKEEDVLLCASCTATLSPIPSRCYLCHATSFGFETCRTCRRRSPLRMVIPAVSHDGLAKELLHSVKYERAQAGVKEMAVIMTAAARITVYIPASTLVVPVPTASSRVRERGYDHSLLLGRHIARSMSMPCVSLLRRQGQTRQVGASRTARKAHMKGAFRISPLSAPIRGKHILLIDDVCTTGATLEEAAHVLRRAGAARVSALVFSQPD